MKSQWTVRNKFPSTFLIIFAASIFVLFGCSVIGKTVPVEKRIPLVSDGIQRGEPRASQGISFRKQKECAISLMSHTPSFKAR